MHRPKLPHGVAHFALERVPALIVRVGVRPQDHVERSQGAEHGEQLGAGQFTQAPLETIAVHGGVLVPRHDEPHPWKRMKGSGDSHVETSRANPLPFVTKPLELGRTRYSLRSAESAAVRPRRTWTGSGR